MSKHGFPTIEYHGKHYAIVPTIVTGYCTYCAFDNESKCPHLDKMLMCDSSNVQTDHILVPDTPKGIAKYVKHRME